MSVLLYCICHCTLCDCTYTLVYRLVSPNLLSIVCLQVGDVVGAAASAASSPIASAVSSASSAVSSLYAAVASLPIASALNAGPLSTAPSAAAAVMQAAAAAVKRSRAQTGTAAGLAARQAVGLAAAAGPAAIAAAPVNNRRMAALTQVGGSTLPQVFLECFVAFKLETAGIWVGIFCAQSFRRALLAAVYFVADPSLALLPLV